MLLFTSDEAKFKYDSICDIFYSILVNKNRRTAEELLSMRGFSSDDLIEIENIDYNGTSIPCKQITRNFYFLGNACGDGTKYVDLNGKEHELPKEYFFDAKQRRIQIEPDTDLSLIRGMFYPENAFCKNEAELREKFIENLRFNLQRKGETSKEIKKAGKIFEEAEKIKPKSFSD